MTNRPTPRFPLLFGLAGVVCLFIASCNSSRAGAVSKTTMKFEHHTINYLEFTVPDMDAAKRFYSGAFGWTFQDYGPEYAGIQKSDGVEFGGLALGQVQAQPRGAVLAVVYTTDLEASLAAVKLAGGTVVKEPFDFPGGRRFQFVDPAGNELAVWTLQGPSPDGD